MTLSPWDIPTAPSKDKNRIALTCDDCGARFIGFWRPVGPTTDPEMKRVRSLARRKGWATRMGDHCPVCRKAIALLVSAVRTYGPLDGKAEEEEEYNAFIHTGLKILGIPPETLGRISSEVVISAMLAEDAAATEAPPKRAPGRPPTPHKHLWITYTVEAYISVPMTRKAAINRAAKNWGLSPSFIDNDVYRGNKLPKRKSKVVREFLSGDSVDDVDEMIRRYREAERK
jgi:hypothetical protein